MSQSTLVGSAEGNRSISISAQECFSRAGPAEGGAKPLALTRIFLRLSEKFAPGADDLQWILYRKHVAVPAPDRLNDWRGVSFVRSTRAILLRCMREAGCKPSREAYLALDGYPDIFLEGCPAIQRARAYRGCLSGENCGKVIATARVASPQQTCLELRRSGAFFTAL